MTTRTKRNLYILTAILAFVTAALFVYCHFYWNYALFCLAVTLLTTLTHFLIRVSLANLIISLVPGALSPNRDWFKERPFEKKLYRLLQVKKWKSLLPTWHDDDFDLQKSDKETLLFFMRKAEVYHALCIALSFLPLVYAAFFGKFQIFLWTSVAGALFDLLFVILQRYNRPRVMRLRQADTAVF